MTGRPHAWASTGAMPKSSSEGNTNALQVAYSCASSASSTRPKNLTFGAARFLSRASSGPLPTTYSGSPRRLKAATAISTRLCSLSELTVRKWSPTVLEGTK